MNRKCVKCKTEISVTNLQRKYCSECKIIVAKKQRSRKKEFDMFCIDCNISLPVGTKADRLYCDECVLKRNRLSHNKWWSRKKLNKFYTSVRLNLIQTPYMEVLQ